ncbi:DUF5618 family protein [Parasediminibacterium sp. JCM 36343]|uniref:DUF5618 family protein n=1 Tax=Parasediminibacterium sp. JCM 36343 TaxID=3374279 RepID=UPI00397AE7F8
MDYIKEANRYLNNAKEILREKAHKEDGYYKDKKYVKLAGHAAYSAVLEALDGMLGIKKKGRKSVDWYQAELAKIDKKILNSFNTAYDVLHLSMGYDGAKSAKIASAGLEEAETIIKWAADKQAITQ